MNTYSKAKVEAKLRARLAAIEEQANIIEEETANAELKEKKRHEIALEEWRKNTIHRAKEIAKALKPSATPQEITLAMQELARMGNCQPHAYRVRVMDDWEKANVMREKTAILQALAHLELLEGDKVEVRARANDPLTSALKLVL